MKKVLVVGCPGVGKTTFARKLAKKTGLPLIHLDFYYHDKNFDYENDKIAWRKKVLQLCRRNEWVIDGNYSSTFQERFKMADTILFFDFPLHKRLYGIFKRRWEYRNKKREDMPDTWRENINWEFIKFVITFHKYTRHKIKAVLNQKTNKKVIVFKNRRDAQKYLEHLKSE